MFTHPRPRLATQRGHAFRTTIDPHLFYHPPAAFVTAKDCTNVRFECQYIAHLEHDFAYAQPLLGTILG